MEILATILFLWLFVKCLKLMLALAWGTAKIIATIILVMSLPLLVVGVVFVGGLFLGLPILLVLAAIGLIKIIT